MIIKIFWVVVICNFLNLDYSYSQAFEVIDINGVITNYTNSDTLEIGDRYEKKDSLVCSDSTVLMAVLDIKNALFIVHPIRKDSLFFPKKYFPSSQKTKGRQGKIINSIALIEHINERSNYLILGDSCSIEMGAKAFPMNEHRFFFIRYYYDGEAIDKKLSYRGNNLIISKKTFFQAIFDKEEKYGVDTLIQISPSEVNVFEFRYYNKKDNKSIYFFDPAQSDDLQQRPYIPIRLVFLEDKILHQELKFVIPSIKKSIEEVTDEELFDRVHAYLEKKNEGKIEEKNLREWWNLNLK